MGGNHGFRCFSAGKTALVCYPFLILLGERRRREPLDFFIIMSLSALLDRFGANP
jgi:hypothetical protein